MQLNIKQNILECEQDYPQQTQLIADNASQILQVKVTSKKYPSTPKELAQRMYDWYKRKKNLESIQHIEWYEKEVASLQND